MNTQKGLKHGVYKIFWKSGGMSLASIGFTHDGTNWYAPCNWTSQFKGAPTVASTDWESIERIELILENNYNHDESESPSPSSTIEPVEGSVEEIAMRFSEWTSWNCEKVAGST
jgi:hypothetical protein